MEQNLSDFAFHKISERIADGTYPRGSKLSIKEISESLNISRTPVSQAINRLIAMGIVEMPTQKGAYVKGASANFNRENIELREVLELFAAEKAMERRLFIDGIIKEMEVHSEKFRLSYQMDGTQAAEHEKAFHELFVSAAGSQRLSDVYGSSMDLNYFDFMGIVRTTPDSVMQNVADLHDAYVRELRAENLEGLKAVIRDHYRVSRSLAEWYTLNN